MVRIKFTILNKPWTLRILEKRAYRKKNGEDSCALTKIHKRRIDLYPRCDIFETLVHEITHAYLSELCTFSADLTVDALEEIFCELMAKHGWELLSLAETLENKAKDQAIPGKL